jgi:hypothetical protein
VIRRPRRVVPATIVAFLLLVACVLVAISCIQLLAGAQPLLPFAAMATFGQGLHFRDTAVLVAGGIAAALGIVLLLCAALPGRPTVLPLTEEEPTVSSGVASRGLWQAFDGAAAASAGVTDARVRPRGRRRLMARVGTRQEDHDGVRDQVTQNLTRYTHRLALAGRPTVQVRVRTREKA